MDTWGNTRTIMGYVRGIQPPKSMMFTGHCHYNVYTGEGIGGQLVNLPPDKELIFWEERLAQIKAVNSADKLELIRKQLKNIEDRISFLKK